MNGIALLDKLATTVAEGRPAVWVTVVATRGSTPRETGASMLVDAGTIAGSIGGGRLELCAIERARALLQGATDREAPSRQLERMPLGARLGQCCGGEMMLAFDVVLPSRADWVAGARAAQAIGADWRTLLGAHLPPCAFAGIERLPVALFGAGHVGRALATLLVRLPVSLTWIDSREAAFSPESETGMRRVVSDAPEAEVATLPPECAAVVMTHSHALDLEIVHAWLRRGDFRFLGLIGSRTKRQRFEHQLRLRGHGEAALSRLVCPIGVDGIRGKEPEVIAVAIAAQLLRLRAQTRFPERQP